MAITSAESYALRRAALSLGDAMGLHLYTKGSHAALVKGTLALQGDPEAPLYTPPQPQQPHTEGEGRPEPETGAEQAPGADQLARMQAGLNHDGGEQ